MVVIGSGPVDRCLEMSDKMEVEKTGKPDKQPAPAKVKADDDTEIESSWMKLADLRYRIASKKNSAEGREKDLNEFLAIVRRFNAVAVYEVTCKEAGIAPDAALVEKLAGKRWDKY